VIQNALECAEDFQVSSSIARLAHILDDLLSPRRALFVAPGGGQLRVVAWRE
jgi:hypothetical protein